MTDVIAFPRGRRPRETKSEEVTTKRKFDNDFLFGDVSKSNNSANKKSKKAKSDVDENNPGKSSSLFGVQLGGGNVTFSKKNSKKEDAVIEALSFKSLGKGTKLLGIVREVNDDFCLVSLPSLLTGYILPKRDSNKIPLSHQISVGQVLTVHVSKVAAETVGKGNQQAKRIELSVEPNIINSTWDEFSQHDVLRGRIKSVEDHGVLVDLGHGIQGFCKFSNVEGDYLTEIDGAIVPNVRYLNEGRILDFIMEEKVISGTSSESSIVSLSLPKSLAKRVTPSTYHPTMQALKPGALVNCKVEAVARNGLLVTFAIFRGAIHVNQLGANWIPPNRQGSDAEWKAVFAEVRSVAARIIAVDARTKVIRLSLQPHVLNLTQPASLPPVGTVIEGATVVRVDPGIGALLSLPSKDELIEIVSPALRKNTSYCEAAKCLGVYVHISKATSDRISEAEFTKEYAPSTRHKVRILSTSHYMDGIATGATAPEIVDAHVLQHSDLVVGKIYRHVPVSGQLEGGSIMVDFGLGVRGLIPLIHLFDKSNMSSDYRNKLRKEKFAVGNKVEVRVLTIDTITKRCIVTAKKSLLKETDCVKDYNSIQVGQRATGFVSMIDDKAIYVTFFNKVYGRVTAHSLAAELGIENHRSDFKVGDVVKCRVISCKRRLGKNLDHHDNIHEDIDDAHQLNEDTGFWDLNLSLHVPEGEATGEDDAIEAAKKFTQQIKLRSGEIIPPKAMKVIELVPSVDKKRGTGFIPGHAIVRIKSKYIAQEEFSHALPYVECKIPYDHILDSYEKEDCGSKEAIDQFAMKHFTVGKNVGKPGLVLCDPKKSSDEYASGIGKLPIISLRPQLIETVQRTEENQSDSCKVFIPNAGTSLFVGAYVQGFVHECDPRYGAFVRFVGDVTGLVPNIKKGMSLQKWDTVTCKVVALDITCQPPKILLRRATPESINSSAAEPTIKCGDRIESVQVLDVNFSRAKVQILDSKVPSNSKVRARIHVSLAKAPVMSTPKRSNRAEITEDKETIGKGHPFFKWTTGKVLKNLICVSSHVSNGVTLVELSTKQEIVDDPSLFLKESSDLQPGMMVSGVIIGIAKLRRGIWLQLSPGVNCFIPALELSDDVNILNELELFFPLGATIKGRVMDKTSWKKKQNWSIRAPKLKTDVESKPTTNSDFPFVSVLLGREDGLNIRKPKQGQLLVGRINRKRRLYRPPSLMIDLRGGYHGRCCITELEEVDDWVNMPIGRLAGLDATVDGDANEGMDETVPPADDDESDGGESQSEESQSNNYVGFKDGLFVQCRVLESIPSDPVVEVSLRTSRLEGDLEDDELPQIGDAVNAYVVNTNKKGCFLRLSRNVEGRVLLKELADGFLHDPEVSFPMGRLVVGLVKAIKDGKSNGKTRIGTIVDMDMRESELLKDRAMLKYGDIKVNDKYKGIVSRVEDYGVFVKLENSDVSGLVHKSECSDNYVKSVKSLYDPGDLVKVMVINFADDGKKLALSMKASHFEGDTDSDDDSSMDDEEERSDGNLEGDLEDEVIQDSDVNSDLDSDDEHYVTKLASKMVVNEVNDNEDTDDDSDSEDDGDNESGVHDDDKGMKAVMDTDVGFEWGPTLSEPVKDMEVDESDDEEDIDDDEEDITGKQGHSSRKKAAARRREEEDVAKREKALADGTAEENPETAADFERLLASDPNNSESWIRFMAYYLSLADMEGCRRIAARALDRIDFRQEGERLNIWTALLTMELKFGGNFDETIDKACKQNNPKQVYLRACELLEKDKSNADRAEQMYERMCKKFRSKKTVWVAHLTYLLKQGRHQEAHALLKRALLSLPSYKHVETMSKLAQLEFEHGSKERGRTVFDGILTKYPKRLDLLFVYVDKEVKAGEVLSARNLFQKTAESATKLSDKQMKKMFRKWIKMEEEFGDEETQENVKNVARAYVERTTSQ